MKKRSFLSGLNSKLVLAAVALSSLTFTGCYKDDGLDVLGPGSDEPIIVADATYTITGTVIDSKTGANIPNAQVTATEGQVTCQNGAYSVAVSKFTEATKTVTLTFSAGTEYNQVQRSVTLTKIEDGQTAVYPLSVVLTEANPEQEDKYLVSYKLNYAFKDVETGADVTGIQVIEPAAESVIAGGQTVVVRTAATAEYEAQTTTVVLPVKYVATEGTQEDYTVTIYLSKKVVDPDVETFTSLSGTIVDVNGKSLIAETIELMHNGSAVQTMTNSASFYFSISSEDAGEYQVVATLTNGQGEEETASSAIYNTANCGNQVFTLVFENRQSEQELKDVVYNVYVNVYDAENKENLKPYMPSIILGSNVAVDGVIEGVEAGVYNLAVELYSETEHGYYDSYSAFVELPAAKNESGTANYVIDVYLNRSTEVVEMNTVTLYGNILDMRGTLVDAHKITFEGSDAVQPQFTSGSFYNFQFTVEKEAYSWEETWNITIEVLDENGAVVTCPVSVTYDPTIYTGSLINVNTNFTLPYVINNGVIDSESGSGTVVDPGVDEDGTVTEDVSTQLTDGETTMSLSQGTVITDAQGNPFTGAVSVFRDLREEENPGESGGSSAATSTMVLRAFSGFPDGTQFSTPIQFTWADEYNGELGNLAVEYYQNGAWGTDVANAAYNDVILSNGTYTMSISHFSEFRAVLRGDFVEGETTVETSEPVDYERVLRNESDEAQTMEVTYPVSEGYVYETSLDEAIAAQFTNEAAAALVKGAIEAKLQESGIVVADQLTTSDFTSTIEVPAQTAVSSICVRQNFEIITYTFTINDRVVTFSLRHAAAATAEVGDWTSLLHGHSHSHGHGNGNAGGGIANGSTEDSGF